MTAPVTNSRSTETVEDASPSSHTAFNFVCMTAIQIVMRIGWIFKTESIVIPAIVDVLSGQAWVRGCLPVLNRFGQSVPPMLAATLVRNARLKKVVLFVCTLLISISFTAIGAMFYFSDEQQSGWKTVCFLVLYTIFFAAVGINQMTFSTLQGKLIPTEYRGRLMLSSNVIGAICAIACVASLMPMWLDADGGRFDLICGFAGLCFGLSALIALVIREVADHHMEQGSSMWTELKQTVSIFRSDRNYRRLAGVAALFSCSFMLFPHYQALGRETLGLDFTNLVWWVAVQNAGTAVVSLVAGPSADYRGNRAVLRVVVFCMAIAPISAVGLTYLPELGPKLFPGVFVLVGMTPVGIRIMANYTLEIADRRDHPKYLSGLGICMSLPIYLSPLVGKLTDWTGLAFIFYLVAAVVFVGWLLTFSLDEPRHSSESTVRLPADT